MCCSFIFYAQRTCVAFQFVPLMTQKSLNLVNERGNIGKHLMIGTCSMMGGSRNIFSY